MKTKTFSAEGYNGGSVTRKDDRTFFCNITVDLHTSHTVSQAAVEHIYTDMLLSGAGRYTREQFIDAVNTLGASVSVNISNSRLTVTSRALRENAPQLLKLMEIMFIEPTFLASEIKRAKIQTTNELTEHREDAKSIARELFVNELYSKLDRRYTDTPEAIAKMVDKVTANDLKKIHEVVLSQHWTVTVSGAPDVEELVTSSIKKCKKDITLNPILKVHEQKQRASKVILHNIPSKQNIEFAIGAPLPLTLHHPDYLPLVFGLNVLGKWGGFTGRLMSTVREKEGLTYGIYAKTETVGGTEQGYYRIMTFFAPNKAMQGLTSTLREIRLIASKGITQKEYERFQTILRTQQTLLADSLTRSAGTLHGYLCADFNLKEIEEYRQRLLTVTRKEVNQALKAHLQPNNLVISGAGPIEKVKKEIQAIL
ncbi:MAG: zinc protease [Acidimicrobiales bacterium]|jgi:zinc protease